MAFCLVNDELQFQHHQKMKVIKILCAILIIVFVFEYCEYEELPGPNLPRETSKVEAIYIKTANPVLSNSPIWEEANFTKVVLSDIVTGNAYGENMREMNGTRDGIESLGGSNAVDLTLKSVYDSEYVYILAEWNDPSLNVAYKNWYWDTSWFRKGNADNLILKFDMDGGSDVWQWNVALSEPVGYALDRIEQNGIIRDDEGLSSFSLNNSTVKPLLEWDGQAPIFEKPSGFPAILDPAYFMAGTTDYIGEPDNGQELFTQNCLACHGVLGETGFVNDYGESLDPINLNRWSRKTLDDYIRSEDHDGRIVYSTLNYINKADLFSFIRSTGGIPGFSVQLPEGSAADIEAQTFLSLTNVHPDNSGYRIMLKRKLQTFNPDDIQFTPQSRSYGFQVLLSHNDDLNFVGALGQELVFLESKY